jgi:hypothetical protein
MCLWTLENNVDVSITMSLINGKEFPFCIEIRKSMVTFTLSCITLEHSKEVVLMALHLTDYGASEEASCKL